MKTNKEGYVITREDISTNRGGLSLRPIKYDISWLKEYLKKRPDKCQSGIEGMYEQFPYDRIEELIDFANRDGGGLLYVIYGIELQIEQHMSWMSTMYKGTVRGDDDYAHIPRYENNRRSVKVFTDFMLWILERGATEGIPLR